MELQHFQYLYNTKHSDESIDSFKKWNGDDFAKLEILENQIGGYFYDKELIKAIDLSILLNEQEELINDIYKNITKLKEMNIQSVLIDRIENFYLPSIIKKASEIEMTNEIKKEIIETLININIRLKEEFKLLNKQEDDLKSFLQMINTVVKDT